MGTGTETLEANLDQKLAGLCHEPLLDVLLDVRKSYNSLERERCMEILRGYGLGLTYRISYSVSGMNRWWFRRQEDSMDGCSG